MHAVAPDGSRAHADCLGRPDRSSRPRLGRRGLTTATKHLTREYLRSQAALLTDEDFAALTDRPRTWGECSERTGPCAWVSCKHHLYLDVNPDTGSIKLNFPDLEPEELEHPCALRLTANGGLTLEEVGERINLTRERVRQVETRALWKLRGEVEEL
jgi:hypothetical protein